MQIIELALFDRTGQRRSIEFRPGALNVITGESMSGKSAIIDILHYCLGRAELTVPVGVISEKVAWYCLRLSLGTSEVFIGRPAPADGKKSSSAVMLKFGTTTEVPAYEELEANTNLDGLVAALTNAIGIGENLHVPAESSTREPLEATIAHALFFCIQAQSEIANRDTLFHRQGEEDGFINQAIRDVLPYFLGAVDEDDFALRAELREATRELKLTERRISAATGQLAVDREDSVVLATEAFDVGLLPSLPEESANLEQVLRSAVDSSAGLDELSTSAGAAYAELERQT